MESPSRSEYTVAEALTKAAHKQKLDRRLLFSSDTRSKAQSLRFEFQSSSSPILTKNLLCESSNQRVSAIFAPVSMSEAAHCSVEGESVYCVCSANLISL